MFLLFLYSIWHNMFISDNYQKSEIRSVLLSNCQKRSGRKEISIVLQGLFGICICEWFHVLFV